MSNNFLRYLEANSYKFAPLDLYYERGIEQFDAYDLDTTVNYGVEGFRETINKIFETIQKFFNRFYDFIVNLLNKFKSRKLNERANSLIEKIKNSSNKEKINKLIKEKLNSTKVSSVIPKNKIERFSKELFSFFDLSNNIKNKFNETADKFPNLEIQKVTTYRRDTEEVIKIDGIDKFVEDYYEIKHGKEPYLETDETLLSGLGFDGSISELNSIYEFHKSFSAEYEKKIKNFGSYRYKKPTNYQDTIEQEEKVKKMIPIYNNTFSLLKNSFAMTTKGLSAIFRTLEAYITIITEAIEEVDKPKEGNESFLSELYSTQLENTNVQFRTDTDLGHICQAISSAISLSTPYMVGEEELTTTMIQNMDKFLDSDQGSRYLEEIQEYSKLFSEKLNDAFSELRDKVAPEVDELVQRINNRSNEYTERAVSLSEVNGVLTPTEPNFTYVDLNQYKTDETLYYANELVKKYLKGNVTSINMLNLRYIVDHLKNINTVDVSDSCLSDWAKDIAIFLTHDEEPSEKIVSGVKDAIKLAFNSNYFSNAKSTIFNKELNTGKINENIIKHANGFIKLNSIFKRLDLVADIRNEEDMKAFKENIETLTDFYKINIVLLGLASEKYQDSLIIGDSVINKNKFDEFTAQGGTSQDIANHLRYNYNHNKEDALYSSVGHDTIPSSGILMNTVLENKLFINEKLESLTTKLNLELKSITNSCIKRAYVDVLREYVEDIERHHPEMVVDAHRFGIECRRMIPQLASNIVRFESDNITDAVYEFYLRTWYSDSLVSNIYYKLGAVLIDDINTTSKLSEDTIEFAHFTVMSDILSEYITKTMIEPIQY